MDIGFLAGAAAAALGIGLMLGWLLGARPIAALRERARQADSLGETLGRLEQDLRAARDERQRLEVEIAQARTQHDGLAQLRDALREERDVLAGRHSDAESQCTRLSIQVAELRQAATKDAEAHEKLVSELKDLRESFKATAQQSLDEAQKKFLERAQERFAESEKSAKLAVGALLQPVHERLARYEETVGKAEAEQKDAFGQLKGQIEAMRTDALRVSDSAASLVNALRNAPKVRGNWGEQQLRNVLEQCGLSEHTDFLTQVSVKGDDDKLLRPDAIVRVPGEKVLVIDAKVSINAYQDAIKANDDEARDVALKAHALAVRNHVKTLSDKAYWDQFEDTPQFVVMFVPGEHLLTAALEKDGDLWDFAFQRRVLLATPTNLIAIARTVDAVWKQEILTKDARRIGELGKELYERLATFSDHLGNAGYNLNLAVSHFNKATNSFNSRFAVTATKFAQLKLEHGKKALHEVKAAEAIATHATAPLAIAAPANDEPEAASG